MSSPTFRELFISRELSDSEIARRYGSFAMQQFDHDNGLPLVVASYTGDDLALLLAGLSRSSFALAPIVVDNSNRSGLIEETARSMGAFVLHEPEPGQMSALQAGLKYVHKKYPDSPVLITDDDCLPQKYWAETLLSRSVKNKSLGGIVYGGVVLEHGESLVVDALRTAYATCTDIKRKMCNVLPKARGPNGILQLDFDDKIIKSILEQPPKIFPTDVAVQNCVIKAGGIAQSTLSARSIMLTRGDRFSSVSMLVTDFLQRGARRHELYE